MDNDEIDCSDAFNHGEGSGFLEGGGDELLSNDTQRFQRTLPDARRLRDRRRRRLADHRDGWSGSCRNGARPNGGWTKLVPTGGERDPQALEEWKGNGCNIPAGKPRGETLRLRQCQ